MNIAIALFKTKNFDINRVDNSHLIGTSKLIKKRSKNVIAMIELLIQYGFDINYRFDHKTLSLFEYFITAISKNQAIDTFIQYGADIYQLMLKQRDRNGNP